MKYCIPKNFLIITKLHKIIKNNQLVITLIVNTIHYFTYSMQEVFDSFYVSIFHIYVEIILHTTVYTFTLILCLFFHHISFQLI